VNFRLQTDGKTPSSAHCGSPLAVADDIFECRISHKQITTTPTHDLIGLVRTVWLQQKGGEVHAKAKHKMGYDALRDWWGAQSTNPHLQMLTQAARTSLLNLRQALKQFLPIA
jgi:hypothetical protein